MARRTDCYCAFCKSPRKVYTEKTLRLRHIFWSLLLSVAVSFIIWREYNPKSLIFGVVAMMTAEIFVRIRWRIHIVCRNCGFDPVLYVKDPNKAAGLVRDFLDRRKNDPEFLLRPPLNLPPRPMPTNDAKASRPGSNVSQRV